MPRSGSRICFGRSFASPSEEASVARTDSAEPRTVVGVTLNLGRGLKMMKNEKWLSTKIRENCSQWFWYSFEHARTWSVPDLHAVSPRRFPFWVETKIVETPNCLLPFRSGQPSWLDEHTQRGGRAFVVTGIISEQSVVITPLFYPPISCKNLVAKVKVRVIQEFSPTVSLQSKTLWEEFQECLSVKA